VDAVTRRWLVAAACAAAAALACSQRAREIQSEAQLKRDVDQMMPAVQRATGMKFKSHPVVLRRSRAQIRLYVIHKSENDLPPSELRGIQEAYTLLGLLPDSVDLQHTLVDLLSEQVAGYYDPDSNALFIGADVDPVEVRTVVSHELVHALQEQYVSLDSIMQQKKENDRRAAAQAVLEGQATLAQLLVMMPEQQLDNLPMLWDTREAVGQQQQQMPQFAHAPMWLRETLIFPYLAGADFVRWFDRTHPQKQPFGPFMPTSTEQILHTDRYNAGDKPIEIVFTRPEVDSVQYENGLGEFETRLLLKQFLYDDSTSAVLATGWGGDRYQVLGPAPSSAAIVWYSVWDDTHAADRFASGLKRAWQKRHAAEPGSRRYEIERLAVDGHPGVRLVDAPADWAGWKKLPKVRIP